MKVKQSKGLLTRCTSAPNHAALIDAKRKPKKATQLSFSSKRKKD